MRTLLEFCGATFLSSLAERVGGKFTRIFDFRLIQNQKLFGSNGLHMAKAEKHEIDVLVQLMLRVSD